MPSDITPKISRSAAARNFAVECADKVKALLPNPSGEEQAKVDDVIRQVTEAHFTNADLARRTFRKYVASLKVIAKTNAIMDDVRHLREAQLPKTTPVRNFAKNVGQLNVGKAQLIAGVTTLPIINRIPLVKGVGRALGFVADLDLKIQGLTGESQAFRALEKLITSTEDKLNKHGVKIITPRMRDAVNRVIETKPIPGLEGVMDRLKGFLEQDHQLVKLEEIGRTGVAGVIKGRTGP